MTTEQWAYLALAVAIFIAVFVAGSFVVRVEIDLEDEDEDGLRGEVTEDELRALGLSGEYYHYRSIDDLDQFWERFGPRIRQDVPKLRARTKT